MNIKPFDTKIQTIFETAFYKIPRFQRPYSWDRGNVEEFWSDVFVTSNEGYFIGSMVLFKAQGHNELQVVDGRQRLTTITIFLAALRDTLAAAGEASLATGVQNVIQRKDINDETRYVLLTETSYPFFQEHVQKFGMPEIKIEPSVEERGIGEAYNFARERYEHIVREISDDAAIDDKKKKERIRKELQAARDKLLALQVITIQLDNEDDAYIIFETLNTRGKDLEPEDLVKNHFARLLPAKSADVDATRTRWNGIMRQIRESDANLDMSTYIHHFWLSREDYTPKKMLFKRMKSRIISANAKEYLSALESGAPLYRRIFEPYEFKWKKEAINVARSLDALQMFRIQQPTPLIFSLLRSFFSEEISLKQLRDVVQTIERFHFAHTAISGQSSSGGVSLMYAAAARDLFGLANKQARATHLQEFRKKLRDRLPDFDAFKAGFFELRFTTHDTRDRPLVRYILEKVDEHLREDRSADYAKMTIEHIAPENPPAGAVLSVADVGCIGNLVFVSERLNDKLKNKSFVEKKRILRRAKIPLDPILGKAAKWTSAEVDQRSDFMAKVCYPKL